jgi:hypothetical protein
MRCPVKLADVLALTSLLAAVYALALVGHGYGL